jgi:prevent-host-death family protein
MTITTLSSREFNQDASRAKKATKDGPVFITDRGKPAHVLLSIEEYQRLTGARRKIADALAMPDAEDIAFNPPRVVINSRPADFS